MSIISTEIKRVFKMNINGNTQTLKDPNPQMTPNEVCQLFAGHYPELTNANIENKGLVNDDLVYEFNTVLGTKA